MLSLPFFFWYSHHACLTPFRVVPQFLGILFCFFIPQSFFFSVLEVFIDISLSSVNFFLSYVQSTSQHINSILHFYYISVFLSLPFLFWFFFRISESLLTWPCIVACCLLYPLPPLSILIIDVLNSQSDHSNIFVIGGFIMLALSL